MDEEGKISPMEVQFKLNIFKIKEENFPDSKISKKAIEHINSLLTHFVEKLAVDTRELRRISGKKRAGVDEIVSALKLMDYDNPIIRGMIEERPLH